MQRKELIIIAGANGVGKTTFAIPYAQKIGYNFLNADEIAKKIAGAGASNAMVKAGRVFFTELHQSIEKGENLVIETTLSGSYVLKVAKNAQEKGYLIKLVYIFVDNEDLCIARVRSRVIRGGHDVPEADIRRRFQRSLANFWENFVGFSDFWTLLYNGNENYQKVATGTQNNLIVDNEVLFNHFMSIKI